jgi:hypothetical protein
LLGLADLPPQHVDILVDLFPGEIHLLLSITRHFHSKVLDRLDTLDAVDFLDRLLGEDL